MELSRRSLFFGALAAPLVVKAASIMAVRSIKAPMYVGMDMAHGPDVTAVWLLPSHYIVSIEVLRHIGDGDAVVGRQRLHEMIKDQQHIPLYGSRGL